VSYCVTQFDCEFAFKDADVELAAWDAVRRRVDAVSHCDDIDEVLHELGWDRHDTYLDRNTSRLSSVTDDVFKAIAPYVKKYSFIVLVGEDGAIWKYAFDGEKCRIVPGAITFEDGS
jgi:hypothetical protein